MFQSAKHSRNKSQDAIIRSPSSDSCSDSFCFCEHFKPIIIYSQIFSIIPSSITHSSSNGSRSNLNNNSDHSRTKSRTHRLAEERQFTNLCTLQYRYISVPNIIHLLASILYAICSYWTIYYFPDRMRPFFEQTDFYALTIPITLSFININFILLYTQIKHKNLELIFNKLFILWVDIKQQRNKNHFILNQKFKNRIIIVLIIATISTISYAIFFIYALSFECSVRLKSQILAGQAGIVGEGLNYCFSKLEFAQKIGYTIRFFYLQCIFVLLSTLGFILRSFQLELANELSNVLNKLSSKKNSNKGYMERLTSFNNEDEGSSSRQEHNDDDPHPGRNLDISSKVTNKIAEIRLLNDRIFKLTLEIGSYFGILVLISTCSLITMWICGFYALILNSENLLPPSDNEVITAVRIFYGVRYFEMGFTLIIVPGFVIGAQFLENSNSYFEDVLYGTCLHELDPSSERQVLLFMKRLPGNKHVLSASKICTIGLKFLSSGIVNSFVFLIILFQFRTSH